MVEKLEPIKGTSLARDAWKRLLKNKLAVFGLVVMCLMIVAAGIGPAITAWLTGFTHGSPPTDPTHYKSMGPSPTPLIETKDLSRDNLSRMVLGGRRTL